MRPGRRVLAAAAVSSVLVGGSLTWWSVPAAATGAPCPGSTGVTVVVDATPLGGGVRVGCASGAPANGVDALRAAGFEVRGTARFPGFVCRIDGAPADDPCLDTAPPDAYWSYWHAPRGGTWTYSDTGAAERTPTAGSVEGWVFSDGSGRSPSLAPPARTLTPTTSPTSAPRTPPPPAAEVAGVTTVPAPVDRSPTPGAAATSGPVPAPTGGPSVDAPAAANGDGTVAAEPGAVPSTGAPTDGTATTVPPVAVGDDAVVGLAAPAAGDPTAGTPAAAGSPWATLLGIGVVAAVVVAAVVVRRRRTGAGTT